MTEVQLRRGRQGEQDDGHGLHFCGWRQDAKRWLQAAPHQIYRKGRHACTTVTDPLARVARIAAKGTRVVFLEDGGNIENKISSKKIAIIKGRGTYAIEVQYKFLDASEEDHELGFYPAVVGDHRVRHQSLKRASPEVCAGYCTRAPGRR